MSRNCYLNQYGLGIYFPFHTSETFSLHLLSNVVGGALLKLYGNLQSTLSWDSCSWINTSNLFRYSSTKPVSFSLASSPNLLLRMRGPNRKLYWWTNYVQLRSKYLLQSANTLIEQFPMFGQLTFSSSCIDWC